MRDIARQLNLSIGAVSLAMRNHPSISAKTALRVQEVAAALHYRPNPALSALAAYRARVRPPSGFSVIALISNWSTADEWIRRPSAGELIAGADQRARALGYSVQHFWARDKGMTSARFGDMLHGRGIEGAILAPFESPFDQLDLDWGRLTAVAIERPFRYPCLHHVVPNHFAAMLLAWEQLLTRGYRRIGFVVRRDLALRNSHQWEAAHALIQSKIPRQDRVSTLALRSDDEVGAIIDWLRRERPEAVINRSEGFLEAVRREGLEIPGDLGYASLNVVDDEPGVSGVLQHRDAMGAAAVDVLHGLLQRNRRHPAVAQSTLVEGSWQEGWTLRPPEAAPSAKSIEPAVRAAV